MPRTRAPRATYLKVASPRIGRAEVEELLDTIHSGWVTTGPRVAALEEKLAAYVSAPHVRCLSSCTAGLLLGLQVLGVGPGDEVLVPSMTFVACANAVVHRGATPVFVDSDPVTGLVDLKQAQERCGPRTKALIAVHLGGHPLDMEALNALRDQTGISILEDAAHAIGAAWGGRRIGGHGNLTAFSFHATKNMTTFEGGALAIEEEAVAERVGQLALHGLTRSAWSRHRHAAPAAYDVLEPGFKCSMHDVAAAVGLHQLARLDAWIDRRADLADAYDAALAGLPLDLPPRPPVHARHAHHLYAVRLREAGPDHRDAVSAALLERNIGTSVHFRAIHLTTYYAGRCSLEPDSLPVARDLSERLLTLPLYADMTLGDVADVAAALEDVLA